MAQHIPTRLFTQRRFRDIEDGIRYAFNKSQGLMKTSLVFKFIENLEGNEVYTIQRKIPKGIMFGSDNGYFEIHYNQNSRSVVEIYLVA